MEEENKIWLFLKKHGSKLLLGLLAIACLTAWSERWLSSNSSKKNLDFVLSEQLFDQFNKNAYLSSESIESVENILIRHPELHSKWDKALALIFLSESDAHKSLAYAKSQLDQAKSELPDVYQSYSEATLLLYENNYQAALEKAQALQKELEDRQEYPMLEAMNLLKVAFLAHHFGNKALQEEVLTKLQKHSCYPHIEPLFKEGLLTLSDFFKHG